MLSLAYFWIYMGYEYKPITNHSFVCYWDTNSLRHSPKVRVELGAMVLYTALTFLESICLFEEKLCCHAEEF